MEPDNKALPQVGDLVAQQGATIQYVVSDISREGQADAVWALRLLAGGSPVAAVGHPEIEAYEIRARRGSFPLPY
jgi:hypothetical protein